MARLRLIEDKQANDAIGISPYRGSVWGLPSLASIPSTQKLPLSKAVALFSSLIEMHSRSSMSKTF